MQILDLKNGLLPVLLVMVMGLYSCQQQTETTLASPTPSLDPVVEGKIDSLLDLMTLEEKIGQLNQYSGSWDVTGPAPEGNNNEKKYRQIREGKVGAMLNVVSVEDTREAQRLAVENSRLGIPLVFGYDVIHGYQTMFPIPLAEAASWDLAAMQASARVAATEAAAAGIHWTFAPMVDISRDARWGRIMEGAGEDPYLASLVAEARVRGFQGDSLSADNTVAACAKHFAAYGFAEGGRDYNTVEITENTLRNVVLPPFKACVDAGVATFMNAFNEIGGVPATGSIHLQRDILKGEWGFSGMVVSDWDSIEEMAEHGVAKDRREAAQLAVTAGSDMDMESASYVDHLPGLVDTGAVEESLIDDAVRRVLRLKYKLGLFEDPYRYCDEQRERELVYSEEHRAVARDVARKSIVLLKNEQQVLPLSKELESIAVIGPLAADKDVPLGSWRAQAITNSATSLYEGVQSAVSPQTQVLYAQGAPLVTGERGFATELEFNQTDTSLEAAVSAARRAEVVVMALGEDCFQSGEGRSQVEIGLKGPQDKLLRAVHEVNPKVVVVLMNGRPLQINWMAEHVPAIVEGWHLGSQAGYALCDVLFGDYNPSGKLPVSFPRAVGQLPLYYNHKNTGRSEPESPNSVFWSHYTDAPNTALYPFGHGLSYTTFEYSDIQLSADTVAMDGELEVSVTVTNTGERFGAEVVQLYIRDLVASTTRPVKELKGFRKIELSPGNSQEVTFTLKAEDLAFYNRNGAWTAEPGAFKLFIGGNSRDVQEADFVLL